MPTVQEIDSETLYFNEWCGSSNGWLGSVYCGTERENNYMLPSWRPWPPRVPPSDLPHNKL